MFHHIQTYQVTVLNNMLKHNVCIHPHDSDDTLKRSQMHIASVSKTSGYNGYSSISMLEGFLNICYGYDKRLIFLQIAIDMTCNMTT